MGTHQYKREGGNIFDNGVLLLNISVIFGAISVGVGYGEPIVKTLIMYLILGISPLIEQVSLSVLI